MKWPDKARRRIDDLRLTYREVEERAGWSPNTLKAALSADTNIGINKAIALANALGVSADWLFNDALDWNARPGGLSSTSPARASQLDSLTRTFMSAVAYASDGSLKVSALTPYVMRLLGTLDGNKALTESDLVEYGAYVSVALNAAMDPDGKVPGECDMTGFQYDTWAKLADHFIGISERNRERQKRRAQDDPKAHS